MVVVAAGVGKTGRGVTVMEAGTGATKLFVLVSLSAFAKDGNFS